MVVDMAKTKRNVRNCCFVFMIKSLEFLTNGVFCHMQWSFLLKVSRIDIEKGTLLHSSNVIRAITFKLVIWYKV